MLDIFRLESRNHRQRAEVFRWLRRNPIGQKRTICTVSPQSSIIFRRNRSEPSIFPTPRLNGGLHTTRSTKIGLLRIRKSSLHSKAHEDTLTPFRLKNGFNNAPLPTQGSNTEETFGYKLAIKFLAACP